MKNTTKVINEKQVTMDIVVEDLELLGDFLTVQQMAQNIKIYNEADILNLIKDGTLPARETNGKLKVKLEDFAEYYAEVFDEIPKNGEGEGYHSSDNEERYFPSNACYPGC